jgi:hypothetical protein
MVFPEALQDLIRVLDNELTHHYRPATPLEKRLVGMMATAWAKMQDCDLQLMIDRLRVGL